MTDHRSWNLISAQDLVSFHSTRRDAYALLAELLEDPTSIGTSEGFWARLQRAHSRSPGFRAIEAMLAGLATEGVPVDAHGVAPPADALACPRPSDETRTTALAKAEVAPLPGRVAELSAMSRLADETARAIANGQLAAASALVEVQAQYIRAHVPVCLSPLARALRESDQPLFQPIARALEALIADEHGYLGDAGVGH